jgi:PAS domain S-box-containing protein
MPAKKPSHRRPALRREPQQGERKSDWMPRPPHQDQRALEESQEHYAELYDYAPFGHLTLDRNGVILDCNLTSTGLLGQQRHDLIGRPLLTLVAKGDRRKFLSHLGRMRRGQVHASTELELRNAVGLPVSVQLVSAVSVSIRHPPLVYHTALVDISQRRRAEARTEALAKLGLLLNRATDPEAAAGAIAQTAQQLCGWDACFLLLYDQATGLVSRLLNMDTIEGQCLAVPAVLEGKPPTPLIHQVLRQGPQLILRRSPQDQEPATLRFGDTARPSLSLMYVPILVGEQAIGVLSIQRYERDAYSAEDLTTLQALANHVGGTLARLHAQATLARVNEELEKRVADRTAELQQYRDHLELLVQQRTQEIESTNQQLRKEIENRELAEAALVHTARELKRSNEELEQFAYVASHDLQEPLRAVGGYVRLLERRFPKDVDQKAREYIQGAAEGANRMERQITDLLALSRVGSGGLKPQWTDLSEPLQAVLRRMQFSIRTAAAKVACDPMPTLPIDALQIEQVFQNLIGNALKFRGENPPVIHIGAREGTNHWVIWVRDNGIGIGPQYYTRIFQVFQRLHTRKKHPGTGIGLAICKKIIERHGGKLWLESEPGKGTTFYFSIPAKQEKV